MKRPHTTVQTIDLGCDQMLVLHDRRGACVGVLYGGTWLTAPAQPAERPQVANANLSQCPAGTLAAAPPLRRRLAARWRALAALLRPGAPEPERPAVA